MDTIGRYELVDHLADHGGHVVYRGFDPMIQRPLVIKLFRLGHLEAPDAAAVRLTFFGDMQRTGLLAHPGIATLFDAGEAPGGVFIANEYIDGASLADQLDIIVAWPLADRVSLIIQLADALAHAGEQGVPHGHLRVSHVLIGEDAAPRIRGFGIAGIQHALRQHAAGPAGVPPDDDVRALGAIAGQVLGDAALANDPGLADTLRRAAADDPAERYDTPGAFKYALLLALNMGESDVRLAWSAGHDVGSMLAAADATTLSPQSAVNGDLTAMVGNMPTQLTASGAEELMTALQPGAEIADSDLTKPA
jgi:hypothetical protein